MSERTVVIKKNGELFVHTASTEEELLLDLLRNAGEGGHGLGREDVLRLAEALGWEIAA